MYRFEKTLIIIDLNSKAETIHHSIWPRIYISYRAQSIAIRADNPPDV